VPKQKAQMTNPTLIDGKQVAKTLTNMLADQTKAFVNQTGMPPGLAVILVGENPASQVYVRNKGKMADKIGFHSVQRTLDVDISEDDLGAVIDSLNDDANIHGILVQLPLPDHIDAETVLNSVSPAKDVDGFHPTNVGLLGIGARDRALVPCTPAGCLYLARKTLGDDLSGRHVVIVGRSTIVGKPAAQLFLSENCTVTIAHSRTRDLPALTRQADILVAAVGRPQMIDGDWIKPGACVIDVGINRIDAPDLGAGKTRLVGDVDFDNACAVAGSITPVPGGVGPMTIAMLMRNTLIAACRQNGCTDIY